MGAKPGFALTQWLGFLHYGDEGKVMGLAPYGRPLYEKLIRDPELWQSTRALRAVFAPEMPDTSAEVIWPNPLAACSTMPWMPFSSSLGKWVVSSRMPCAFSQVSARVIWVAIIGGSCAA